MSEKRHSLELGLDYKVNDKTGNVHFNDKSLLTGKQVIYTPEEIKIIRETFPKIPKKLHIIKSIFGGEIVRKKIKASFKDKHKRIDIW